MLIATHTFLKINSRNRLHLLSRGYAAHKIGEVLEVQIEDLLSSSKHLVLVGCDECKVEKEISYCDYSRGVKKTGSYFCNKCCYKKTKQTNLERYGVEFANQNEVIYAKTKQTNMERYGVEFVSQYEPHQRKASETLFNNYGVTTPLDSPIVKEKFKQTCLDNHGVEHPFQSDSVKERIKLTNLTKHGVEYATQSAKVKQQTAATNLERYGYTTATQHDDVKAKTADTCLIRYGVTNVSKIESVKQQKKFTFASNYGVTHWSSDIELKTRYNFTLIQNLIKRHQLNLGPMYNIKCYVDKVFTIHHEGCGAEFQTTIRNINNRKRIMGEICTACAPINSVASYAEQTLTDWLDEMGIVSSKNRSLIGKEIDIYIPSKKLGIEFNGVYWHSELFKPKSYHQQKTHDCQLLGVQLLHIFEDDWKLRPDIIKSIIRNKLGLSERVYARQCHVLSMSVADARRFLEKNHIQGYANCTHRFGLYYSNELVSIMTFGLRNTNGKQELELIRFSNKLNTHVVGGSMKLFSHFIKHVPRTTNRIISFCNRALFTGQVYLAMGFTKTNHTLDYYWVVNGERKNRFLYNKKRLVAQGFPKESTEIEIMHSRGYYRIWGAGQEKWTLNL